LISVGVEPGISLGLTRLQRRASAQLSSAPPKNGWGLAILKGCGRKRP
jgi:hypothetical protein